MENCNFVSSTGISGNESEVMLSSKAKRRFVRHSASAANDRSHLLTVSAGLWPGSRPRIVLNMDSTIAGSQELSEAKMCRLTYPSILMVLMILSMWLDFVASVAEHKRPKSMASVSWR